jgi:type II secretory pathway component GspD/PulD (secretin)
MLLTTLAIVALVTTLLEAPRLGTAQTLPARGNSATSEGSGVLLRDAIRAYARFMRINTYFIDSSVPNVRVSYSASGLDPVSAFNELLQANGLADVIDSNGVLHVGSVAAIALHFGPTTRRLAVRSGTPTSVIPALQTITHGRVAFVPDDAQHALYAIGHYEDIALAQHFLAQQNGSRTDIVLLHSGVPATDIERQLAGLAADSSGSYHALTQRNAIALYGDDDYIATMKAQIAALDIPPSQVYYTVSFIEITPVNDNTERGIQLGPIVAGHSSASSGSTGSGGNGTLTGGAVPISQISATLDALASQGRAKILERNTVTSVHGGEALGDYTNSVPIIIYDQLTGIGTPRTVDSGVRLQIDPSIGTDAITSTIDVKYSEITGYAANGYPELAQRHSSNTVTTHNGDTIVISGLYVAEDLDVRSSNPPFSYIPIFGGVFRHRSSTQLQNEVIIVATPNIAGPQNSGLNFQFPAIDKTYQDHGILPASQPNAQPKTEH